MGLNRQHAVFALLATFSIAGCTQKKVATTTVGTAKVERRDITVDATATGAVEPIDIVEVKSKAGGLITKMPVETGTQVKAGQLLVQIDTRDVQNQYEQAKADVAQAQSSLDVASAQKKRSDELFKTRVITTTEYETATLSLTQAQAGIVRANTNLDLAKQRLEDATVVAPVSGTVIERPVSEGMVIAGATGSSASGGTTLLKMADLSRVQIRVLVPETDIGNIRSGQTARVVVDAFPDRPFAGSVEKIEPQAIVSQSVTMFPVIVSLANEDGFLKPGMNGEVSVLIEDRSRVIAVPNDAVRNLREAVTAAALVGLNGDSVQAYVRANGGGGGRGGRGGAGAGAPSDAPATTAVATGGAAGAKDSAGRAAGAAAGGERRGRGNGGNGGANAGNGGGNAGNGGGNAGNGGGNAGNGGGNAGNGGGNGNGGAGRRGGRGGDTTRAAGGAGGQGGQGRRGGRGGNGGGGGANGGGQGGNRQGAGNGGGNGGGAKGGVSAAMGGGPRVAPRSRSGLVFVQTAAGFEPRVVRLGASNYDYSEVLSGVQEGETVATLAVAALQAKRDAANDRQRAQQGGAVPGMNAAPGGGGGGAGGRGGRQ